MRSSSNGILIWMKVFSLIQFTFSSMDLLEELHIRKIRDESNFAKAQIAPTEHNSDLNFSATNLFHIYSEQNKDVILKCYTRKQFPINVWWKDGVKVDAISRSKDNEKMLDNARYIIEPNGDLWIQHTKLEDDGEWQCQAQDYDGYVTFGDLITLCVLDPPKKIYLMIDNRILDPGNPFIPVKENTDLKFSCVVDDGNPKPNISWDLTLKSANAGEIVSEPFEILNDTRIALKQGGRSDAVLKKVIRTYHNASVTCSVSHIALQKPINISVLLNVQYSPSFAITREPGFGLPIKEGMVVSLKCDVDANPKAQPIWRKDDVEPPIPQTYDGFLNFSDIRREHIGWYKCITNHLLGKFSSIGYFLSVRYDIESTQEPSLDMSELTSTGQQVEVAVGESVQLNCPAGTSGCWSRLRPGMKELEPLGESEVLKLDTVIYQEAGKYICVDPSKDGMNKLDHLKKSLSINVAVKGLPIVTPYYENVTVAYGQPLTLTMDFCANPPYTNVFWIRNNKIYVPGDGDDDIISYDITNSEDPHCHQAVLFLTKVKNVHTGEYIFVVRSRAGLVEGIFNVSIINASRNKHIQNNGHANDNKFFFVVTVMYVIYTIFSS